MKTDPKLAALDLRLIHNECHDALRNLEPRVALGSAARDGGVVEAHGLRGMTEEDGDPIAVLLAGHRATGTDGDGCESSWALARLKTRPRRARQEFSSGVIGHQS